MSDGLSDLKSDSGRKRNHRIITSAIVVFLLIASIVLYLFLDTVAMDSVRRYFRSRGAVGTADGTFSYDAGRENRYAAFGNGLAVASGTGLALYDETGGEFVFVQCQMNAPCLKTCPEGVLVFDAGGINLHAYGLKSGTELHLTDSGKIFDADYSADGYICVSAKTDGYKTVLSVYNPDYKLIYKWNSSSQFLPFCTVNRGGKLIAATAFSKEDSAFCSEIILLETDAETIMKTITVGDDLIYDLEFLDNDIICAVGENAIYFYDTDGLLAGQYIYPGCLKEYSLDGAGFVATVIDMQNGSSRSAVKTIDYFGKESGQFDLNAQVLSCTCTGKYVAVLTSEDICLYSQALSELYRTENLTDASNAILKEDGSVLLLSRDTGYTFYP